MWKTRVKKQLKKFVESASNCKITRTYHHGYDPFQDMKNRVQAGAFKVVFDVGANDGRSAVKFAEHFPSASIYCFEPVNSTYQELEANMSSVETVKTFNVAMGAHEGDATVVLNANPLSNSIRVQSDAQESGESVSVCTIDAFCQTRNVPRIDFLKIDTEGFDLEVLKGSKKYLSEQRISFLQVEASMNPQNLKHIAFDEFRSFLKPLGYSLFGLYDQTLERSGEARLRFANPIFISDKLV